MNRVALPQLFENMEEATIGAWLVSEGSKVEIGTPLCELITEKTTLELPAECAGTLRKIVAPAKAIIPAGYILALIGDENEEIPDVSAENAAISAQKAPSAEIEAPSLSVPSLSVPPISTTPTENSGARIRATPAARRAAKDLGISIEDVAAKFPGKVIGEDDVKAFSS
ncbi:MAG TPA: biotin/lipoyl-containing protein [Abditibacterium sp.]|jgi:pyruvate dehydrogenase E2 component (dihydrolipoamide acetyltransferase)